MTIPGSPVAGRRRQIGLIARCAPGLGRMLRRQLAATAGAEITGTGYDGEADLVFAAADRESRRAAGQLRLADDVFAELGRARRSGIGGGRSGGAADVARLLWQAGAVQRALSAWADDVRPLSATMTFRVGTAVLRDSAFTAADLRRALTTVIGETKPRWRFAADARLAIWAGEWHDGQYAAGLRLADGSARARGGHERSAGGLPGSLAAALVQIAGPPGSPGDGRGGGLLLDPCCGGGAILAEAARTGWTVSGTDIDETAVRAAAVLVPGADIALGDAREVALPDDCVQACVSWLPARMPPGKGQPGGWPSWSAAVLAELSRVTRSGGSAVLLAPEPPRASIPSALRLRRQVPVRGPAGTQSIWVFRRA